MTHPFKIGMTTIPKETQKKSLASNYLKDLIEFIVCINQRLTQSGSISFLWEKYILLRIRQKFSNNYTYVYYG